MQYRRVPRTDILVSEISLGCWTIGGPNFEADGIPSGWAPADPEEVRRAVARALDMGVNHFDNADVYGNGLAERLLADALGPHRNEVIISDKVGWFRGTAAHAYEPQHIRHQCEQSLVNLQRDYIDIYYFHHGDFGPNDRYLDDAVAAMLRLKEEGKIRAIGLSAYSTRDFKRLVPRIRPDVLQSWANAMDDRFIAAGSQVMQLCREYDMAFTAFSPLNQGILLGRYSSAEPPQFGQGDHRARSEKFKAPYLARAECGLEQLARGGIQGRTELARAALQFVLGHEYVLTVLAGFRDEQQVAELLEAADRPLTADEMCLVRHAFRDK